MALIGEMQYLTIGDSTYEIAAANIPIASSSTLGGIKVGTGLTIDAQTGVLNATGTSITIDSAMSNTSTNPVQNKVITETFNNLSTQTEITGITLNTTSIYQMNSTGSVTAGTATTPAQINVQKFSGGSFTRGAFSGGSFTQGSDSFTPASLASGFYSVGTATTPASINVQKFSGGSYSHSGFSGGSFTSGTFTAGSLTMAMDSTDTKKLNITFTAPTHASDSFTAASYGTDSFTAASLGTGFYTAGTKGSPTTIDTSKFSGGSFTQGTDSFTAATHAADSFTAASLQSGFYTAGTKGTPTAVTLPTRQSVTVADGNIVDNGHAHTVIDARYAVE